MRTIESDCLDAIKDSFFGRNNMHIWKYNGGLQEVKDLIFRSAQTINENEFPDFFSDGGIIEHFIITASKETRKGSYYKIHEFAVSEDTKKHFNEADKEFTKRPYMPNTTYVSSMNNIYNSFTYEDFVVSFKKNFDKHYNSLIKSNYSSQKVIFLIQQDGARLCIYKKGIFDSFYLLSEDKQLLQYLKDKYPAVDYVILKQIDCAEIIDLSEIDNLITSAKTDLDIRGGRMINASIKTYSDL